MWLRDQFKDSKKENFFSQETLSLAEVTESELKEFFAHVESTAENPAFINDFIEICWVDPWAEDPANPKLKEVKKRDKKQKKPNRKKSVATVN